MSELLPIRDLALMGRMKKYENLFGLVPDRFSATAIQIDTGGARAIIQHALQIRIWPRSRTSKFFWTNELCLIRKGKFR
jgi:hypothetical protein